MMMFVTILEAIVGLQQGKPTRSMNGPPNSAWSQVWLPPSFFSPPLDMWYSISALSSGNLNMVLTVVLADS